MPAAYRIYLRVTEEKPDHVAALAKVGQVYAASGDLVRAREQAERAVKLEPEHPDVLLLLGLIDFRANDFARARERATAVLAKDPGNVDATGLLARILEENGQVDEAVAVYDAALRAKPEATPLRLMKTKALERANRFDAAAASYRELIGREPKVYEHRLNLARAFERRGERAAAEAVLREAIAAGVGASRPKLELLDVMVRANDVDAADAELIRMATAAPEEYPLQFRLADRHYRSQRPGEAKAVLEAVVKRDPAGPNGITARLALARIALREGNGDVGDALLAEVIKLEPGNDDALLLRAGRSLARNEPEPAIIDLRTVLRDVPNSAEAKRLLANAYFMAGKSDLAEKQLSSLIEENADDAGAKFDLAYLQARRGASSEALALLDEVASAVPSAVAPLRAKAMMMIAERQWASAEETIARIGELPDQQLLANMLSGILYLASERPKDAAAAFAKAQALAPTAVAPVNGIVRAHLAQGDVEGAARFVRGLTAENPDSGYLQNSYGELLMLQGKRDEAVGAFETARRLTPDSPLPYFNLSRSYIGKGDSGSGLAVLDEGLQKIPADPLLLRAKADALVMRGQHAEALPIYLKLAADHPDDDDAANNAAALIADFEYQDPAKLQRAVELVKRFETSASPNYLDTLGWVRYRTGDYELARVALTRAARRLPDDPQVHYHLGMVKYRLGDREGARAALELAAAGGGYPGLGEAQATLRQLTGSAAAKP
jgi:tetratricopeptide (TPR) repeat protein